MPRLPVVLSAAYLAGGVAVWVDFAMTNPDGLANVGLLLYVLPVTMLGLALGRLAGRSQFLLIPDSFGYWTSHALFFFPSLLAVAGLIYWSAVIASRIWQRRGGR
jgi:hypothetical protein